LTAAILETASMIEPKIAMMILLMGLLLLSVYLTALPH
jgi:Tfp pilus assembly protein PilV